MTEDEAEKKERSEFRFKQEHDGDVVINKTNSCNYNEKCPEKASDIPNWLDNIRSALRDTNSGIRWIDTSVSAYDPDDGEANLRHRPNALDPISTKGAKIRTKVNVVVPYWLPMDVDADRAQVKVLTDGSIDALVNVPERIWDEVNSHMYSILKGAWS